MAHSSDACPYISISDKHIYPMISWKYFFPCIEERGIILGSVHDLHRCISITKISRIETRYTHEANGHYIIRFTDGQSRVPTGFLNRQKVQH